MVVCASSGSDPPSKGASSASDAAPAAPAGNAAACQECVQAAAKGNILQAQLAHAQCTNASVKANCTARASQTAGKEAVRLSRLGRCAEAKAVMQAALQMGVPEAKLASGWAACP